MPAGMNVCGFKVLSAVSVAVRHPLTGDRNEGTSCYKPQRFKQEGSYSRFSMCPGDIPIGQSTHSRFRAIDRQLNGVTGGCTGAGDLVGWFRHFPGRPISGTFFRHVNFYIVTRFITFLCFWHIIPV